MQKGFATIIVIAILLVITAVGAGAYYLNKYSSPPISLGTKTLPSNQSTPALDEATNWKTYTNFGYKFSISYPSDWSIKAEPDNLVSKDSTMLKLSSKDGNNELVFGINMFGDLGAPEYIRTKDIAISGIINRESIFSSTKEYYITSDLCLDNKLNVYKGNEGCEYVVKNVDSYNFYQFSFTCKTPKIDQINQKRCEEQFDQILSTFRFTEKSGSWGDGEILLGGLCVISLPDNIVKLSDNFYASKDLIKDSKGVITKGFEIIVDKSNSEAYYDQKQVDQDYTEFKSRMQKEGYQEISKTRRYYSYKGANNLYGMVFVDQGPTEFFSFIYPSIEELNPVFDQLIGSMICGE